MDEPDQSLVDFDVVPSAELFEALDGLLLAWLRY